ncbi:MAG TPA: MdtA/MuxA family multidrug efflux RND transporter periplasmic adaptor subunit [Methylocella sp.]|nr:MdtA/MuxA family multidrug efflux RND transporter periplasmic adaptor subunit [Methylocella sp.]
MDDRTRGAEPGVGDGLLLRERTPAFPGEKTKTPHPAAKRGVAWRPLAIAMLLGLFALAAYRIAAVVHTPKEEAGTQAQATPQPVAAATIDKADVRVIVNALGTVTPIATVTVKTQVNGQLLSVGFTEGQTVKKGDFLAQIDPRPFEAAKAQLEGQLIHDQGLLDQARRNLARYQMLLKQDSIARQQAEDQAFLVTQYEGSVKADQALIEAQKLNLLYARIVSPIDGRIGLRMVDPGNYVQTSDNGIAVVTQMHPISVIFVVPEDDIPPIMEALRGGKTLEVTAYDRANITPLATGQVSSLDSQIDPSTGTVRLRANFENLDDKLFPNQFVNVRLMLKTLRDAVTVPARAVLHGAPGDYVYVIGSDETVTARKIELGPRDGAIYAVTSGLAAGEKVVVDGLDRLRDGAKVRIVQAGQPPGKEAAGKSQSAAPPGQVP